MSLPNRTRQRLTSLDALRGLVMVFMCLDHTREYFGDLRLVPEDLVTTTPTLFFTRWITHFCAPTFVFLAGVSAWLYGRTRTKRQLAAFLFYRGAWLVFLEFTLIHFGWLHTFGGYPFMFIVIAAIGTSMMALALMIFLPYQWLALVGISIVFFHNTLDHLTPEDFGQLSGFWKLLHDGGHVPALHTNIGYPVLPWIGVIACGFVFGPVMQMNRRQRIRCCLTIGAGCVLLFLQLRMTNLYGDPSPWSGQHNLSFTVMSFLSCTKYPPSLLYVAMTLGPALLTLALFEALENVDGSHSMTWRAAVQPLVIFGRVPLFFYVVHLYLIHGAARLFYWIVRGKPISPLQTAFEGFTDKEAIYGFPLSVVFAAWIVMLVILWPLCRKFGVMKSKGRSRIWSYL